jgi:glycolate oxidase iron-sulfur subunit
MLEKFVFGKMLTNSRAMPFLSAFFKIATAFAKAFPWMPGAKEFTRDGKQKVSPEFQFAGLKSRLPSTIPAKGPRVLKAAYFTGCMADWAFQSSGLGVINVLTSYGAEVTLIKDEVCCGAPAYFAGDFESAKTSAEKNLRAFAGGGFDYIVTSCATCGSVLKEIYPLLIGKTATDGFSEKVVDFQKLLLDRLKPKTVAAAREGKKIKVTYHDPCHLSRGMKITKEPRELLKNLPGVEFVEMAEADSCCGGGGTFNAKSYADSMAIGERKARNIAASGAEIVVTECPSCQMQLMDLTARHCPNVRVMQTSELLSKYL